MNSFQLSHAPSHSAYAARRKDDDFILPDNELLGQRTSGSYPQLYLAAFHHMSYVSNPHDCFHRCVKHQVRPIVDLYTHITHNSQHATEGGVNTRICFNHSHAHACSCQTPRRTHMRACKPYLNAWRKAHVGKAHSQLFIRDETRRIRVQKKKQLVYLCLQLNISWDSEHAHFCQQCN